MGIVRGPAGIGKSHALALIEEEFSRAEDDVLVVTARASTGGASTGGASTGGASTGGAVTGGAVTGGAVTGGAVTGGAVTRLFGKAVPTLGIIGSGAVDPMERMERFRLQSFPFRGFGPRKVRVVDECRHLKANVIECLRYIHDRGEAARRFDPAAPAFGLVLVGNGHFLTRATVEWDLDRPPEEEIAALAAKLCPDQAGLQAAFVAFGVKCRNVRQTVEASHDHHQIAVIPMPAPSFIRTPLRTVSGLPGLLHFASYRCGWPGPCTCHREKDRPSGW